MSHLTSVLYQVRNEMILLGINTVFKPGERYNIYQYGTER